MEAINAAEDGRPSKLDVGIVLQWLTPTNERFRDVVPVAPALLRDIFGNPFRRMTFEPRWATANVVGLATAIHAERAFDRMPVLGDAIEEAGCTDDDLLWHCRGEHLHPLHVRGCWVVDLILGKA
jgi:hypothetical protein